MILLRHGETVWNVENRLTGWADVDLSAEGVVEARRAGRVLRDDNLIFDIVYTSVLRRAVQTAWLVLEELDLFWIPVEKTWRLNERHYGVLQGMSRIEAEERYGREQILTWKRSFDVKPPGLDKIDDRYPGNDPRYRELNEYEIPVSESLKDTLKRVLPYWQGTIDPTLKSGKRVLIVTHGDIIRAIMKHTDAISDLEIKNLQNIPTGTSIVYEFDEEMKLLHRHFLGEHKRSRRGWEQ